MTVETHRADGITAEVDRRLTGEFAALRPAADNSAIVRPARTGREHCLTATE